MVNGRLVKRGSERVVNCRLVKRESEGNERVMNGRLVKRGSERSDRVVNGRLVKTGSERVVNGTLVKKGSERVVNGRPVKMGSERVVNGRPVKRGSERVVNGVGREGKKAGTQDNRLAWVFAYDYVRECIHSWGIGEGVVIVGRVGGWGAGGERIREGM